MTGEDRISRAKFRVFFGVGAILALALISLAILVIAAIPYAPLTIYSYEPTVSEVCSSAPVRVVVDSELADDVIVRSVEIVPEWTAVDVPGLPRGTKVENAENTLPAEALEPGRSVSESRVARPAPLQPGVWRHGAHITVRGIRYQIPTPQTITARSEKTTTVLSANEPRCDGKPKVGGL